jgi:hypothetical protein
VWLHAFPRMGVVGRVCVCVGVGGALVLSLFLSTSSASAQSALLDALSPRVTIAHPSGSASEVAAEEIIRSGDTIATDHGGRAVVTYPDGSTALLEESSSLTIEFLQMSAGDYVVRMRQTLGRVWYAVTKAVAFGSRYEVRSAGMASVIRAGSDSYVSVSPAGEATIVTISGTVDTSAGGVDLTLPAGSSTTVSAAGAAPSDPTPAPASPPVAVATQTRAPSPSTGLVLPVATRAPMPASAETKPKTPAPSTTLPIPTPKPTAAPAPAPTPVKDGFGPRKDAPGQPPPKTKPL